MVGTVSPDSSAGVRSGMSEEVLSAVALHNVEEIGTEVETTVRAGDIPTIIHLPTISVERADGVPCHSIRMFPGSLVPRRAGATSRLYCQKAMLIMDLSSDQEIRIVYPRKIFLFNHWIYRQFLLVLCAMSVAQMNTILLIARISKGKALSI